MTDLRCTACGAQTETKCSCGKPYDYIPAHEAAARAVASHPDWSDVRLAQETGVSDKTIGRARNSGSTFVDPDKRVGRDGRTQAARQKRGTKSSPKQDKVQDAVDAQVREGKPVNRKKVAEEYGVGETTVHFAIAKAQGKMEAEPVIRPEDLSLSAQKKLDLSIQQHKSKLDDAFEWRVQADIKRRVDELVMPRLREREQHADQVIKARKGVFKLAEYNAILRCVHPDTHPNIEQKTEAFRSLHENRLVLLSEKEDPVPRAYRGLPTVDEFMSGAKKGTT